MAGSNQGTAYIDVLPSMNGYFQRIRTELNANSIVHELEVKVKSASLTAIRAAIQNKFDQQAFKISVEASANSLTALRTRIQDRLNNAFQIDARISSASLTSMRQQIAGLNGLQVEVKVKASAASLQLMRQQIQAMLNGVAFSIDLQINTAAAQAALDAWIRQQSGRTIDVNVDVDRRGGIQRATRGLGGLAKAMKIATIAGAALGAAGLGIGAIGALALGAMPAMVGLAGVMGVVALGADGIKEAFATVTPQFDALKASASAGFKDALMPAMEGVGNMLTALQGPIQQLAGSVGTLMSDLMGVFTSPEGIQALTDITNGISQMVAAAGPGLTSMVTAFRDMFASLANSGAFEQLGAAFGTFFQSIGDAFRQLSESGVMDQLVSSFSQILSTLGPVFGQLIVMMGQLGATLGPVVAELLGGLAPILTSLTPMLQQMAQTLGNSLLKIFDALAPVIPVVAQAIADLFDALAPVIVQLVEALAPILKELAPVFAELGTIIAGALSDAIKQMAPFLPELTQAFVELVRALLPLLPPLLQLITSILPILMPLIIKVAQVFTTITNVLVPLLIPAIEFLTKVLGLLVEFVVGQLISALDLVQSGWEKIGEIIQQVPGWFEAVKEKAGEVVDWVVEKWDGFINFFRELPGKLAAAGSGMWDWIKDTFKGIINTVIGWWNNFSITFPSIDTHIPGVGTIGGWTLDTPNIPELATGGPIQAQGWLSAPGTTTSDGGLFYGSNKEFVVNAKTMASPAGRFIERANAAKGIPRFADGGNIGGAAADTKKTEWAKFLESIGYKPPLDEATGAKVGEQVTSGIATYKQAVGNVKSWADVFISGGEIPGMESALRPVLGLGNPDQPDATPSTYQGAGADNASLTAGTVTESAGANAIKAAIAFARGESGKPYQYGGVGNPSWDCSGLMSGIYATIRGLNANTRWFTTESDFTGQALGFVKGAGPGGSDGFGIGVHNGGGGQYSHMAGTLAGTSVESGGNGVLYGGAALGAGASQFESRYYLPLVKEAATAAVAEAVADMANVEGAGAARWRDQAIAAMKRQGFNYNDPAQVDAMVAQIQSESGGDPKVMQQVQDVNSGVDPAGGLLQVIGKTYQTYRDPALVDDRFNGFSNMNAALRYYKDRYGMDLTKQWGQGHGYDKGGVMQGMGLFGKWTNQAERVLSPGQTDDFHQMLPFMGTVADHLRANGGWGEGDEPAGGGPTINLKFGDVKTNSWDDAQAAITTDARRGMRSVLGGTVGGR